MEQQMYLDLGQRSFGTAECKLCGMLFVHGLKEDTETHAKVCEEYKSGIAFPNRIKCRSTDLTPPTSRIVEVCGLCNAPPLVRMLHASLTKQRSCLDRYVQQILASSYAKKSRQHVLLPMLSSVSAVET
jgi:zinc-finger of acetyl-transferase ESCO